MCIYLHHKPGYNKIIFNCGRPFELKEFVTSFDLIKNSLSLKELTQLKHIFTGTNRRLTGIYKQLKIAIRI